MIKLLFSSNTELKLDVESDCCHLELKFNSLTCILDLVWNNHGIYSVYFLY